MAGAPEGTRYLSVDDVMALHREMMRRLGAFPAPLRDERLLESAVMRPQTAAYYEDADLVRQAALLAAGIIQNHPYVDGNKRKAYITEEATAPFETWLRSRVVPLAGG